MKTKVRLGLLVIASLVLCGAAFTRHFTAAAECSSAPRSARKAESPVETMRAMPALPGMRSFTRGAVL